MLMCEADLRASARDGKTKCVLEPVEIDFAGFHQANLFCPGQ
jgi:hypothetical protein